MGRIIFATRDTGSYERMGRDLRGMTDLMQNALCRNEMGSDLSSEDKFWARIMGCQPDHVRHQKEYFFAPFGRSHKVHLPDGTTTDAANVATNQLKLIGCEELQLLIHLHLQCEIHAWVSEADRPWFSSTLESAMDKKLIYRDQKLLDFLNKTARGPIVLSYSVCDEFPYPHMVSERLLREFPEPDGWDGDEENASQDYDVYAALAQSGWTEDDLWDACFEELIQRGPKVQLSPERIKRVRFGDSLTLYDVVELWREHDVKNAPKEEPSNELLKALIEKQPK